MPLAAQLPAEPDDPLRGVWLRALALGLRPAIAGPTLLLLAACVPLAWLTTGPSLCPFKIMTGLPCPGCGMTRSVVALLHGDLAISMFYHPLGPPLVLLSVALASADAWIWQRSRQPGHAAPPASWLIERVMATPVPWVAIAALTLVWVVRLPLYVLGRWTF